ncbi:hypothetical protein ACOSQ3_006025 [Xanthoceras sorbifolium]
MLETYLGEQFEDNPPNFSILSWWKVNKGKYSILAKIVEDMLAIPVSTVASESAFSTGGRFLSPHCRKLHPDMLEVLMCAASESAFSTGGRFLSPHCRKLHPDMLEVLMCA